MLIVPTILFTLADLAILPYMGDAARCRGAEIDCGGEVMAFRVVDVQSTPNPNAMKFILDRPCSDNTVSFLSPEQGSGHPLAEKLFAIRGVASLLLLGDFITVNKRPDAAWGEIRPAVEAILMAV